MDYHFLPSALAAAGLSWLINGIVVRLGRFGVIYLAPAVEEVLKTGSALFFGAFVPASHILFGLVEAVWDIAGKGRKGVYAGLAGVVGHTAFGLITYFVLRLTNNVVPALAAAYFTHMGWNFAVLYLAGARERKGTTS